MGNRYLKPTQKELLKEFSKIIDKPIGYIQIRRDTLNSIVEQLGNYIISFGKPTKIIGERPERLKNPSETKTHYRKELSDYIVTNTNEKILLPIDSTIPARFYDMIADCLGL